MQEIQSNTIQTMSTREIALLCEKEHKNVLRTFRSLVDQKLVAQSEPLKYEYRNQQFDYYTLSKRDSLVLVARLSPEFTAKVVDRWQELESKIPTVHSLPQSFSEALQLAADQAKQLELQAPKVEFVDNYVSVSDTKTLSDVAKLLNIPNRQFFKKLTDDKILFKRDGDYRPYAYYEKYFTMKTGSSGDRSWVQCRVNGDGIVYLSKRYS